MVRSEPFFGKHPCLEVDSSRRCHVCSEESTLEARSGTDVQMVRSEPFFGKHPCLEVDSSRRCHVCSEVSSLEARSGTAVQMVRHPQVRSTVVLNFLINDRSK